jgi:hypothetical protein
MPNVAIPSRNVKNIRSVLTSLCVVQVRKEPGWECVAAVLQMRGGVVACVHPKVSLDGLERGLSDDLGYMLCGSVVSFNDQAFDVWVRAFTQHVAS